MLLSSILSACIRNGVTVTQLNESRKDHYILRKGDKVLDLYSNSEGYVGHITYRHPDTDAMTDLFMDTYFNTISSAMHELNPTGEMVKPIHISRVETVSNNITGVSVTKNEEKNGIEIRFNEKPSADVINTLKDKNFRWSPFNSVWWKKFNDADYEWARLTFCNADEPAMA